MAIDLRPEFEYFLQNQAALVEKYNGQFVVIKGQQVIGAYASAAKAVAETQRSHELGTFLVQEVSPGAGGHTQTFHSRVMFA